MSERLLPDLLALVACSGQGPSTEPTLARDSSGLHVTGVYGPATVGQQVPGEDCLGEGAEECRRYSLQGEGYLFLVYDQGTMTAHVDSDLTGDDTVVVLFDGELLEPEQAWVEVDGEVVACLNCEVPDA